MFDVAMGSGSPFFDCGFVSDPRDSEDLGPEYTEDGTGRPADHAELEVEFGFWLSLNG